MTEIETEKVKNITMGFSIDKPADEVIIRMKIADAKKLRHAIANASFSDPETDDYLWAIFLLLTKIKD
jgi:hypothetical protein